MQVAANALHPVTAGRQVFRLEAALLAADHHEGQALLIVLQFHEGAGDRLPRCVVDDTGQDAVVLRRRDRKRGDQHRCRRASREQIPRNAPAVHLFLSLCVVWLPLSFHSSKVRTSTPRTE